MSERPFAEGARRPRWEHFRAALDAKGFRPSRRLGQNFLLDENQALAIARDAAFSPGEFVLEVGAGCGFLSTHLVGLGARLLAVEIDPRLAEIAAEFLGGSILRPQGTVDAEQDPGQPPVGEAPQIILTDVLAGKHALAPALEARLPKAERWHLVSNLPYSVSAPVLSLCAAREYAPVSMTVLVQLEVAERAAAQPGTRSWGPLSITLQSGYEASVVRHIGPASFWPRPKVDSAVLRLERREVRPSSADRVRLRRLVERLFQRRRQTLQRVLGDVFRDRPGVSAVLAELDLEPATRAENLPIPELDRLSRALEARFGPIT